MDWLLFNSGPMYYKTKEMEQKKLEEKKTPGLEELFRHRVLLYFYKYKKAAKLSHSSTGN